MEALAQGWSPPDAASFLAVAERFATSVAWSDLRREVSSCPGWSTYDLVVHLGNVHAWAATIVETGRRAPTHNDEPRSARGKAVASWYGGKAGDLYAVLRDAPPDRPCWNFVDGDDGVAAFWVRRQVHETTMHHLDLDLACGRTPELATSVASDGVSEVLGVLQRRMHSRHPAVLDRPLALEASDTGDTWVMLPQSGPPLLERTSGGADEVADRVAAPVDMLYRMLWRRPVDASTVRVSGDESRVRAFLGSRLVP